MVVTVHLPAMQLCLLFLAVALVRADGSAPDNDTSSLLQSSSQQHPKYALEAIKLAYRARSGIKGVVTAIKSNAKAVKVLRQKVQNHHLASKLKHGIKKAGDMMAQGAKEYQKEIWDAAKNTWDDFEKESDQDDFKNWYTLANFCSELSMNILHKKIKVTGKFRISGVRQLDKEILAKAVDVAKEKAKNFLKHGEVGGEMDKAMDAMPAMFMGFMWNSPVSRSMLVQSKYQKFLKKQISGELVALKSRDADDIVSDDMRTSFQNHVLLNPPLFHEDKHNYEYLRIQVKPGDPVLPEKIDEVDKYCLSYSSWGGDQGQCERTLKLILCEEEQCETLLNGVVHDMNIAKPMDDEIVAKKAEELEKTWDEMVERDCVYWTAGYFDDCDTMEEKQPAFDKTDDLIDPGSINYCVFYKYDDHECEKLMEKRAEQLVKENQVLAGAYKNTCW